MGETEKRPPGRPKGTPKTGGRQKGTKNRDRLATVARIQSLADPIKFLCDVCRGVRMQAGLEPGAPKREWLYPTSDQRISAAQTLARKVLPDMKSVEHAGPLGEPLSVRINLGS